MSWKQAVQERQKIVLATSSKKSQPHAIIVISLGLIDNKILIGACLMKTSLENIKNNGKVSMVVMCNDEYYRIEGKAEVYSTGKYFDEAYRKSKPPMPKAALVINIEEVFDLDKQKKVSL
jgi:predicted pyridoxine 5'-phosphate oxidase superfamily flavin-nucleotide-binding protein